MYVALSQMYLLKMCHTRSTRGVILYLLWRFSSCICKPGSCNLAVSSVSTLTLMSTRPAHFPNSSSCTQPALTSPTTALANMFPSHVIEDLTPASLAMPSPPPLPTLPTFNPGVNYDPRRKRPADKPCQSGCSKVYTSTFRRKEHERLCHPTANDLTLCPGCDQHVVTDLLKVHKLQCTSDPIAAKKQCRSPPATSTSSTSTSPSNAPPTDILDKIEPFLTSLRLTNIKL